METITSRESARNRFSICSHCGSEFRSQRCSARYCGSTCRKAANRKQCHANSTADSASGAAKSSRNGASFPSERSEPINAPTAKKPLSVTRGYAIVPDAKWPGMYRIRRPDGSLTDLLSLTRARDAWRSLDGDAA
jgi:hypothetical protein